MIITLPNNFKSAVFDINIPEDEPMFRLTLVKGGVLLYNTLGVLIGQIFYDENSSTAVIADGASIRVERTGNDYTIKVPTLTKADKKKLIKPESQRKLHSEYSVYGNIAQQNYQIFERKKGITRPSVIATVISVPLEDKIRLKIEEGCNILRVISLVLAIILI